MNILKILLIAVFVAILLNSCFSKSSKSVMDIEGLWISTEETSTKFLSGTQQVVLQIRRDSNEEMAVRGVFLWNGDYQSEWKLVDIQYNKLAQRITILDADADTLKYFVDVINDMIIGAVHLKNKTNNPLSFIRADKNLESRLFHPRIPDINGNISYSYIKPEQIDDGLQTTSIYNESIDTLSVINLIKEIINQKYGRMESLLILMDNKLIVEEYFYGYNQTHLHKIHSCTKSITSLLLGIALDKHKIEVDQPLFNFFPSYDDLKTEKTKLITLKHALTMTAGFQWNEFPKEMYETDDWLRYILSRPLETKPDDNFHYNSGLLFFLTLSNIVQFYPHHHLPNICQKAYLFPNFYPF